MSYTCLGNICKFCFCESIGRSLLLSQKWGKERERANCTPLTVFSFGHLWAPGLSHRKQSLQWSSVGSESVGCKTQVGWTSNYMALHQNSSTLASSCKGLAHWKRLWCWEELGAGEEGDNRRWDGWMASPTRWMWVSVNSRSWWWTGRPGVLRFMGS